MESQKPQFDVLQAAESLIHEVQLKERPVVLQPFVVQDILGYVAEMHDRRVENGIYEPLYEGGPDIAHELLEKMAFALPATNNGYGVEVPLNNPQIKFIRELLEEERQKKGDAVKNIECDSDIISFENAVEDSLLENQMSEKSHEGALELTDKGREMAARLLREREKYPRRMNVRAVGSSFLQWKLAAFLDEEQRMRPKYSPEFDESYEVGKKTLASFGKEKTIEKDTKGNPKLTEVILTREQIDYLTRNIETLTAGVANHQAVQIRELVDGISRRFDSAPIVMPRKGKLRNFFNKFTGQK